MGFRRPKKTSFITISRCHGFVSGFGRTWRGTLDESFWGETPRRERGARLLVPSWLVRCFVDCTTTQTHRGVYRRSKEGRKHRSVVAHRPRCLGGTGLKSATQPVKKVPLPGRRVAKPACRQPRRRTRGRLGLPPHPQASLWKQGVRAPAPALAPALAHSSARAHPAT